MRPVFVLAALLHAACLPLQVLLIYESTARETGAHRPHYGPLYRSDHLTWTAQVLGEAGQYISLAQNSSHHTRSENQHEPQPRKSLQHTFTFKDTSDYCQSFDPPDRLVVGEPFSRSGALKCTREHYLRLVPVQRVIERPNMLEPVACPPLPHHI